MHAALLESRSEVSIPAVSLHEVNKVLKEEESKQIRARTRLASTSAMGGEDKGVLESKNLEPTIGVKVFKMQVLFVMYSLIIFFPKKQMIGFGGGTWHDDHLLSVCPLRTLCAESTFELSMLFISRTSAFYLLPPLIVLFWSKFRASATFLSKTVVSLHFPLAGTHDLHALCGRMVCYAAVVHTIAHLLRWSVRTEAIMVFTTMTGFSGLVAFAACILVGASMAAPSRLRQRFSWEARTTAHGLYWVMVVALMFHHWFLRLALLVVFGCYLTDRVYCIFCMTEHIEVSEFTWVGSGTLVTFDTPSTTISGKGYVEILVPFLSKYQWHPFSVFPSATEKGRSSVFIQASGDWSRALHDEIALGTTRPIWIRGPFVSPFDSAVGFDNIVLVATGIGITPVLAIIDRFRGARRVPLVWICREASLVEFFLCHFTFDEDSITVIFYTGKVPLNVAIPKNVAIFKSRPDLNVVMPTVIRCTAERTPLPSHFLAKHAAQGALGGAGEASQLNLPIRAAYDIGGGIEDGMGLNEKFEKLIVNVAEAEGLDARHIMEYFEVGGNGMISEVQFYKGLRRLMPQGEKYLGSYQVTTDLAELETSSLLLPADEEIAESRNSVFGLMISTDPENLLFYLEGRRDFSARVLEQKLQVLIGDVHLHAKDVLASWTTTTEFTEASTEAKERAVTDAQFLHGIGIDNMRRNWCTLYCGGSKNVIANLEQVSEKFGPQLKVESFDW